MTPAQPTEADLEKARTVEHEGHQSCDGVDCRCGRYCESRVLLIAQALADERHAAMQERDSVWKAFVGVCEDVETEADKALETAGLTEHERGYHRGMKHAAKSIRRSVEHPKYTRSQS